MWPPARIAPRSPWMTSNTGQKPCRYLLAESSATLATMYQVYRVILDVTFARLMRHKPYTFGHRLLFVATLLWIQGREFEDGAY